MPCMKASFSVVQVLVDAAAVVDAKLMTANETGMERVERIQQPRIKRIRLFRNLSRIPTIFWFRTKIKIVEFVVQTPEKGRVQNSERIRDHSVCPFSCHGRVILLATTRKL